MRAICHIPIAKPTGARRANALNPKNANPSGRGKNKFTSADTLRTRTPPIIPGATAMSPLRNARNSRMGALNGLITSAATIAVCAAKPANRRRPPPARSVAQYSAARPAIAATAAKRNCHPASSAPPNKTLAACAPAATPTIRCIRLGESPLMNRMDSGNRRSSATAKATSISAGTASSAWFTATPPNNPVATTDP